MREGEGQVKFYPYKKELGRTGFNMLKGVGAQKGLR